MKILHISHILPSILPKKPLRLYVFTGPPVTVEDDDSIYNDIDEFNDEYSKQPEYANNVSQNMQQSEFARNVSLIMQTIA